MLDFIAPIKSAIDWVRAPDDPMFGGNAEHYAHVGESALRVIAASHILAGRQDPASILDFACATGRVTRWLRAAYPDSDLHVADIREQWVRWSAETFGATGWVSSEDLSSVTAPRQYDLIWSGSLATHISARETRVLLRKFHEWLTPGGICALTTHGRKFIALARARTHAYFPDPNSIEPILAELAVKGYGYVPHPGQNHGISANTIEWMIRAVSELDARVITISENAWDNHQDVVAFQKL